MTASHEAGLVVVLEDDRAAAEALTFLLNDWGYDCAVGSAVEEALSALQGRTDEVRAVISDYHLRDGGTGIEAIAVLAEHGVTAPTLLLTGTLRGAARRTAAAAGYQFMEKPVSPARLQAWLNEAVDCQA